MADRRWLGAQLRIPPDSEWLAQALEMRLDGELTRSGVTLPILVDSRLDTILVSRESLSFLATILADGASTGATSAVWELTATLPGGAI